MSQAAPSVCSCSDLYVCLVERPSPCTIMNKYYPGNVLKVRLFPYSRPLRILSPSTQATSGETWARKECRLWSQPTWVLAVGQWELGQSEALVSSAVKWKECLVTEDWLRLWTSTPYTVPRTCPLIQSTDIYCTPTMCQTLFTAANNIVTFSFLRGF